MLRLRLFTLGLVLGLAALAMLATWVVRTRVSSWADQDLTRRSLLAVSGARELLEQRQATEDVAGTHALLEALTRDERLVATALCDVNLKMLAATAQFPPLLDCAAVQRMLPEPGTPASSGLLSLAGSPVHLSAVSLSAGAASFVVLIHDVTWVERRERELSALLLAAFAICALIAAGAALFTARASVSGVRAELQRMLTGRSTTGAFAPLMRDVRDWLDELRRERDEQGSSADGTPWTPGRLRSTLASQLEGSRVVVLANREPYIHNLDAEGKVTVQHPASGLVTALEPVMRACGGVWVAHGSGTADRENSDAQGRLEVPGEGPYGLKRVWLSAEEERGYYYGFSNEGLWPLCHLAHNRPEFRSEDWRWYQEVNQRFADAVCEEVEGDDPLILVQDYHFALAPRMLRKRLPRATIISFWHIPWPNAERFGICPWRQQLLDGLLGSSIVGFHTQQHCNNFLDSTDRFLEARLDRERNSVSRNGHTTLIRPYPIGVEWPVRWVASQPSIAECTASVVREAGLAPGVKIGLGVDRLDYTKGVEERFLAVERLFERHPEWVGRFSFVQLAAPSRTVIPRYRALQEQVEAVAARICTRFGRPGWQPVVLLRAHHEPPVVFRHYRGADVCYVSSLHDGMNLVAKEYVAARDDEQGVLVLSHFTGAARELAEALIVNPYDLDEAADALHTALLMSPLEQKERMHALRSVVREFNVYRWAGRMLVDAARLRRHNRVSGRLAGA